VRSGRTHAEVIDELATTIATWMAGITTPPKSRRSRAT